jgi:hypothetical protein
LPEEAVSSNSARKTPDVIALCAAHSQSNHLLSDIDRRITALPPDDPALDILWQELEAALSSQREVVSSLTNTRATDVAQLRAKAAVLAALLRSGDAGGYPVVPERTVMALALSLTDDFAGWSG